MNLLSPLPAATAREEAGRQARSSLPETGFDLRACTAAFEAIAALRRRKLGPVRAP